MYFLQPDAGRYEIGPYVVAAIIVAAVVVSLFYWAFDLGRRCGELVFAESKTPPKPVPEFAIAAVDMKPGDTLVLSTRRLLCPEACAKIRRDVEHAFPGVRAMLLDAGLSVAVAGSPLVRPLTDAERDKLQASFDRMTAPLDHQTDATTETEQPVRHYD